MNTCRATNTGKMKLHSFAIDNFRIYDQSIFKRSLLGVECARWTVYKQRDNYGAVTNFV